MRSFIFIFFFLSSVIFSQEIVWQQTLSSPEGGGVTSILDSEANGYLFVTTGSFNYPNGADGGIRRSSDDGITWQNVFDAFTSRVIIEKDGALYASVWDFPSAEGLYRSTDGGNSWGTPLFTVPSGDNIFSIAVSSSANLFVGTRNGVYRSMDSGNSWEWLSTQWQSNSWVRDLAIDTSGNVAAATTNGVYISTDNGNSWLTTTGIPSSDTTVSLFFDYSFTEAINKTKLMTGTNKGNIYESFANSEYTVYALAYLFDPSEEVGRFTQIALAAVNEKIYGVGLFPKSNQGGGVGVSNDGVNFRYENSGLPSNPKISSITSRTDLRAGNGGRLFVGLYENSLNGAKIYISDVVVSVEDDTQPVKDFHLFQNYPNPFNPSTKIRYTIPVVETRDRVSVQLKVYDVLGNEVAILINEYKPAGSYEVEFDANGLSSGVYFYRLQANDLVETKQMILLK